MQVTLEANEPAKVTQQVIQTAVQAPVQAAQPAVLAQATVEKMAEPVQVAPAVAVKAEEIIAKKTVQVAPGIISVSPAVVSEVASQPEVACEAKEIQTQPTVVTQLVAEASKNEIVDTKDLDIPTFLREKLNQETQNQN